MAVPSGHLVADRDLDSARPRGREVQRHPVFSVTVVVGIASKFPWHAASAEAVEPFYLRAREC